MYNVYTHFICVYIYVYVWGGPFGIIRTTSFHNLHTLGEFALLPAFAPSTSGLSAFSATSRSLCEPITSGLSCIYILYDLYIYIHKSTCSSIGNYLFRTTSTVTHPKLFRVPFRLCLSWVGLHFSVGHGRRCADARTACRIR